VTTLEIRWVILVPIQRLKYATKADDDGANMHEADGKSHQERQTKPILLLLFFF
jgi:hypothetical protein